MRARRCVATGHCARELEVLFREAFPSGEAVLEGGATEPEYLPGSPARIRYREDFFASALHEVAHWCIAGAGRRQQHDYGYWYAPDGRDSATQRAFEDAEARPQALEWSFAQACGAPFRLSLDNLENARDLAEWRFALRVLAEARRLQAGHVPPRARRFLEALARAYGGPSQPERMIFREHALARAVVPR